MTISDEVLAIFKDPDIELTQANGKLSEMVAKRIHGLDVDAYTVLELSTLIDTLQAIRKARMQQHFGLVK